MRFSSSVEQQSDPTPSRIQLRDDASFAANKIAVFQYTAVAIFLFLVTGFWELQIKSPEIYNERAERNRLSRRLEPVRQALFVADEIIEKTFSPRRLNSKR